jgi:hypothetical protein
MTNDPTVLSVVYLDLFDLQERARQWDGKERAIWEALVADLRERLGPIFYEPDHPRDTVAFKDNPEDRHRAPRLLILEGDRHEWCLFIHTHDDDDVSTYTFFTNGFSERTHWDRRSRSNIVDGHFSSWNNGLQDLLRSMMQRSNRRIQEEEKVRQQLAHMHIGRHE